MKLILKICCLLMIFINLSCEDIQNNRRLVFSGNLIDENNQPIQNAQISSTLNVNVTLFNAENLIGQGRSDDSGNFEFVSLIPLSSEAGLSIDANTNNDSQDIQDEFVNVIFSISREILNNTNEVQLQDFKLPRKTNLNINIEKTSSQPTFLEWSLEFISSNCFIELTEINQLDDISFCNTFRSISGQNTSENPDETRSVESLRNSTVVFVYSVNNEPNQIIEIPLNNSSNVFEFTY